MKKNISIGILSVLVIFLTLNLYIVQKHLQKMNTMTIGELVTANIEQSSLEFISRVDTGAESTSIHAENIVISNKSSSPEKNIGKSIQFDLRNNKGETLTLTKKIEDVRTVRNAEKKEERYYVFMEIEVAGVKKDILVNLNDREEMTYKLLLGRNFLSQDFLIHIKK